MQDPKNESEKKANEKLSEFLLERLTGLGGADAHHYMCAGARGCQRRVVYEKLRVEPDYPFISNAAIQRGITLEDTAAKLYSRKTGRKLLRRGLRRHRQHDCLIVHQDRAIVAFDDRGPGVLEIKVVGREAFAKYKRDGLPEQYTLQLQHGMLVPGYRWGSFCIYWADGHQVWHWDVAADEELHNRMRLAGLDTWSYVERKELPPALPSWDDRCRKCPYREKCQGAALMERIGDGFEDAEVSPEVDEMVESLRAQINYHKNQAKFHTGQVKSLKSEIEKALGSRVSVGRVKVKASRRKRLNVAALIAEHPELAEKYSVVSTTKTIATK